MLQQCWRKAKKIKTVQSHGVVLSHCVCELSNFDRDQIDNLSLFLNNFRVLSVDIVKQC